MGLRRGIAGQANLGKDDILDKLERSLKVASLRVLRKPLMATAAVAAISRERDTGGRIQTYLHVASSGDAQVIILGRDKDGNTGVTKIVEPADLLDRQLREKDFDMEEMPVDIARMAREQRVKEFAEQSGMSQEDAERVLTQSGIYAFLGGTDNNPKVRLQRINLSEDRFAKGYTDVRVLVCSDNVGEKVPEDKIIKAYAAGAKDNKAIVVELNRYMAEKDWDDGSISIASVGGQWQT